MFFTPAELKSVRRNFVKKMTKEIIRQLLDDLYEAGVLNEGEKDSILEENPATAEKARVLIDTVVKKGDEASRKMIDSLQSIDAELFSSLGLQGELAGGINPHV